MPSTENDRFAKTLRFKTLVQRPDFAEVEAFVEDAFLNGVDIAHGGFLFTLCDYALALAANTDERVAISSSGAIEYVNPVPPHTKLVAVCNMLAGTNKSGYYETKVFDADRKTLFCIFHSRAVYKPVLKSR